MGDIKNSALELIGKTPILKLNRYSEKAGISGVTLLAKLEYLNPAGSVKDPRGSVLLKIRFCFRKGRGRITVRPHDGIIIRNLQLKSKDLIDVIGIRIIPE